LVLPIHRIYLGEVILEGDAAEDDVDDEQHVGVAAVLGLVHLGDLLDEADLVAAIRHDLVAHLFGLRFAPLDPRPADVVR